MKQEIIIDVSGTLTRVVLREEGDIQELYVEGEHDTQLIGSVFKGKVQNILPGMQAAFIDIGFAKNAFLYVGDLLADKADFVGVDE